MIVFALVAAGVAAIVVLLVTGEAQPVRTFEDPSGDPIVGEGKNPPADTALADIRSAEVSEDGDEIVLEAKLGAVLPERLEDGAFGLRWEVHEDGESVFLITANLDVGPNATIVGEENDYGSNTLEESFPGSLAIDGDTVSIRIRPEDVPDFPESFAWLVQTSLDGDQGDARSARAEDRAPDQGFGEYPTDE